MVLLGLELENNVVAFDFMQRAKERTKVVNLKNNPYTDYEFSFIKEDSKLFYLWKFNHLYPNFSKYFLLLGIIGAFLLVLGHIKIAIIIWLVSGFIVLINEYGRSRYFNFFALRIGLRKFGYKGACRLLSTREMVDLFPDLVLKEGVLNNGSS